MTAQFRPNVTRIKGLSDRRRMPLLGKIRLGIKKKSAKTGNEYPAETDYFVCPPEVQAKYGNQPKSIRIMVPLNDIDSVFPTAYCFYGSGKGIKCKGDGETAWAVDDNGEMVSRQCPCEQLENKKCKQVGRFMFMIPEVSVGGVYQLSTSSFNSIVDIQSGLDYVAAIIGRFDMVELELKREPTETHHDGQKQTHYTVKVFMPPGFNTLQLAQMRENQRALFTVNTLSLPAPIEENPVFDDPDMIIDEEDEPQGNGPKEPTSTDKELSDINADLLKCTSANELDKLWTSKWGQRDKVASYARDRYHQIVNMFSLRKKEISVSTRPKSIGCTNTLCDANNDGCCINGLVRDDEACKEYIGGATNDR